MNPNEAQDPNQVQDIDYFRNQLLHMETISMMTKYQLVFIKMESTLNKVSHIIRKKESINVAQAFSKINSETKNASALRKYKTQLVYYSLKDNTSQLVNAIANLHKKSVLKGFKALWFTSKAYKNERVFKEEKEKYTESLVAKDREITQYAKKLEELNSIAISSKNKEAELMSKLKQREKQISALEVEKADVLKSKKSISGENTALNRALEEKLREMQQENEELKDKLYSAENNVGIFVKEMSELLDYHELSTNIGSDDNMSFHNQEVDDEFGSSNKLEDKIIQNLNRGKENNTKTNAQRMGYQPTQTRHNKV